MGTTATGQPPILSEKALKDVLASSARSDRRITEETLEELANVANVPLGDAKRWRDEAIQDADDNPDSMPFIVG
jgi:hypothetical protein